MKSPRYQWVGRVHDEDAQVFFSHTESPLYRFELYRGQFSRLFNKAIYDMNRGAEQPWAGWKVLRLDGFLNTEKPIYLEFRRDGEMATIVRIVHGAPEIPIALVRDLRLMGAEGARVFAPSSGKVTTLIPAEML